MMKECGSSSSSSSSSSIRDHLPPGYRFVPSDHELLIHLHHRITHGVALTPHIRDVRLYDFHPQTLTETYPAVGDREWYFFTPRNRKHPRGFRPDRVAGGGFWKAMTTVKKLKKEDRIIGHKQTLVYHTGKNKAAVKTNWMMHEYRVHTPTTITLANRTTLDGWVLCRVYKKATSVKGSNREEDVVADLNSEAEIYTQILDQQFYNTMSGGGYMIHGGDVWTEINQQDFPSLPLLHNNIDAPAQQFNNIGSDGSEASTSMQGTSMSPQDYNHVHVNAAGGVEQLCNGNNAVVQRDQEDEMGEYMRMLGFPQIS